MNEKLRNLIIKLGDAVENEDFIEIAENVIDEIEKREDQFDAVELILKLIENHPNTNFGKPGPLVHFVEKFYKKGYEEKLVESIKRRPTQHTVWMLNRIINGSEEEKKKYFLSMFDNILRDPSSEKEVVLAVTQFKNLHV